MTARASGPRRKSGKPRDFTKERQMIAVYRKLGSCAAAATVAGVSRQRAHYVLKRAGVL